MFRLPIIAAATVTSVVVAFSAAPADAARVCRTQNFLQLRTCPDPTCDYNHAYNNGKYVRVLRCAPGHWVFVRVTSQRRGHTGYMNENYLCHWGNSDRNC